MITWEKIIEEEKKNKYFIDLIEFVNNERKSKKIYPKEEDVFNSLKYTPFNEVKVVIIGQDPYHQPKQAHGLSFSIADEGAKTPPSIKNIYKEINSDLGVIMKEKLNLTSWAKQGVLLINTILTVEDSKPLSHQNKGWEILTKTLIKKLSENRKNIVFILWGSNAQSLEDIIENKKEHLILKSPHPSPFAAYRGFLGNKHFSKTNDYLIRNKITPIKWDVL